MSVRPGRRPPPPPAAARAMQAALRAHQAGEHAEAEAGYRALTSRYPSYPDPWHYWGLLLQQQGRREEAIERLAQAQNLDPDNLVYLLNLGQVLREQGQFAQSIACLQRAQELDRDHAQTLVLLTQSMLAVELGGELVPEIERHLERAAGDWHLWMLLGECREQAGDREGALSAFAEAAVLAPAGEPRPHLRRGSAAHMADDTETARRCFEAALAISPDLPEAKLELARLASEDADFERAEELAREAYTTNPQLYPALYAIAATRSVEEGDPLIEELEEAARNAGNDPTAWSLHFARGRIWEKLGEYDRAFDAYERGNRIRGEMRPYSRPAQAASRQNIIDNLDAGFIARRDALALPDPGVIFVCGMPRSGTTLVETILASHPDVTAGGEIRYVHDRIRQQVGVKNIGTLGSWLRYSSDDVLAELGHAWREHLLQKAEGRRRITDKMPGNYTYLGFLQVLFPDSPIVHVHRDPRDTCFSCYATPFAEAHNFSYDLVNMGHYHRLYQSLMDHWRQLLGPERIIEVEYEALVAEPEPEIRRLLDAVGLPWDPSCLDFHQTRRKVATASVYQVRQPLYSTSIGRWRHFERHLGPLLAALEGREPQ